MPQVPKIIFVPYKHNNSILAPEAQSQPPQPMARSEEPSVPTGVRIDQAKVLQLHNDLVRFTDNFALEKLERIYTAMAKVIFYEIESLKDNLHIECFP